MVIDSVKKILINHNFDFSTINFNQNLISIINDIEHKLIFSSISLDKSIEIMSELWKYQNTTFLNDIKNNEISTEIEKIKLLDHYTVTSDFIIYDNFIRCKVIKSKSGIHILNDDQIERLVSMGYGINSFKIKISLTITDVWCDGNHPNLSSSFFCMDNDLKNIIFTCDNIELIQNMLSQFNMNSTFLIQDEWTKIMGVINE